MFEVEQSGSMDIILLDIEMEGVNGIETAGSIRKQNDRVILIFISFYDQYCKEIIGVQPFSFLDKPVKLYQLETVLKHAVKVLGEKEELFEYSYQKVSYRIPARSIYYFYSERRKIHICSEEGDGEFYQKPDEVEVQLRNLNAKFACISKSYLINLGHIKEFHYEKIVMRNGQELHVSTRYKDRVKSMYIELIQGNVG